MCKQWALTSVNFKHLLHVISKLQVEGVNRHWLQVFNWTTEYPRNLGICIYFAYPMMVPRQPYVHIYTYMWTPVSEYPWNPGIRSRGSLCTYSYTYRICPSNIWPLCQSIHEILPILGWSQWQSSPCILRIECATQLIIKLYKQRWYHCVS